MTNDENATSSPDSGLERETRPVDEAETTRLERQVERGQLFTHGALGESYRRLGEVETFLHALIDTLLAAGVVSEDRLTSAARETAKELRERGELSGPGTVVRVDPSTNPPTNAVVDCASRIHVCKAVCCKLNFALSVPEVEAGAAKWDLGRPYMIRHDVDGYCVHADRASGACGIYASRPGVCRGYSCEGDIRIWKDFDRMQLNAEWLDANLDEPHDDRPTGTLMAATPMPLRPR